MQVSRVFSLVRVLVIVCAIVSVASTSFSQQPAKTTALPEPGMSVGVAFTNTPGRWRVYKAAPFSSVVNLKVLASGEGTCVIWQGTSGEYTACLIPVEQSEPWQFATVVLGGSVPVPKPIIKLSLAVPSVVTEGDTTKGTVINTASSAATEVTLFSNSQRLTVESSVTTPPGTFVLVAPNNDVQDGDLEVAITASAGSSTTTGRTLVKDNDSTPVPLPDGKLTVVVLYQSSEASPALTMARRMVEDYVEGDGYVFRYLDPDQRNPDNQTQEDIATYQVVLGKDNIKLPAFILIISDSIGTEKFKAYSFPDVGTTPESGLLAGQKVIGVVKENLP